jgi:D-3-phosphoglycerate dehydrogenase
MPKIPAAHAIRFLKHWDRRQRSRKYGKAFPKDQIPILLLEGVSDTAAESLKAAGYSNIKQVSSALKGTALANALKEARILGIRSRTRLTADFLERAENLIAVGCFSVGTNQVDLEAARILGIPVFNAPFSNTRSVAELTIAEIIMLVRGIFPKSVAAHGCEWRKSALDAHEIRGKTLGIVGYGSIGSQLALLAEGLGMRVCFYDHTDKLRHGNVEPAENLLDLLGRVDVVSLHLPETPQTRGMFGEQEIRAMRPGAFLINNARGSLVDLDALAEALIDGHLRGAALDVFPAEPSSNDEEFHCPLQGLHNVILTPHVAGSTKEAQERIGTEIARKLIEYIGIGSTTGAVNFPQLQLPINPSATRFIQVQRNIPGELKRLNDVLAYHANADAILAEIRDLEGSIRVRMLHQPG